MSHLCSPANEWSQETTLQIIYTDSVPEGGRLNAAGDDVRSRAYRSFLKNRSERKGPQAGLQVLGRIRSI